MLRIRTGTDGRGNIGGSIPEEGKDKRRIGPDGKVWGIMAVFGFQKRISDTMMPCSHSSSFCSCSLSSDAVGSSSFCWYSMEDRSSHHMFFSSSLKDRNTVGSTRRLGVSLKAPSSLMWTLVCRNTLRGSSVRRSPVFCHFLLREEHIHNAEKREVQGYGKYK